MDRYDVLAVVGIGLLGYGLWQIYPPLALIVTGVLVLAAAVLGSRAATIKRAANKKKADD